MKSNTFDLKKYAKSASLGIASLGVFLLGQFIIALPLIIFNIEGSIMRTILLLLGQTFLALVLIYIFKERLWEDLLDLLENHESYFKKYFKYWFYILIGMALSNLLIIPFSDGIAQNQENVLGLLRDMPVYMYFSAVFFAPLTEELVFRQGFRQVILNDKLFILLSGLSFGVVHIISSNDIISQLPFLPAYTIPGLIFAYLLVKSKNIFVPMGIHFVHNGVLVSLQIIAMIFGGI